MGDEFADPTIRIFNKIQFRTGNSQKKTGIALRKQGRFREIVT
jgi:hypothetical protein